MDKKAFKGGETRFLYFSFLSIYKILFSFTKAIIQRDGLLPCWKIAGKCAYMHILGKFAYICTYRENVHMCTYKENLHISLKQPGKR